MSEGVRREKKGRTVLVCGEVGGCEVVCGRAGVELPSEVEDVVFGEACGSEAVKATQRLDLRLLCNIVREGRGAYHGQAAVGSEGMAGHESSCMQCYTHLCLCLAVFLLIGKLRADRAV